MGKKSVSGVVLKETYLKARKRGILLFILTSLAYTIAIIGLLVVITEEKEAISSFSHMGSMIDEYRTKDKVYGILRTKGYSLGQGLDIAEAIVKKSKELELPLALIMAVIDYESEFYPNARSDKGAQGLMQIMPLKWDQYVTKLNWKVNRRAMADPFMNITVGCQILKDLYDDYKHIKNDKVKMAKVLTDYNNGEKSTDPNLKYAVEVGQKYDEYQKKLRKYTRN